MRVADCMTRTPIVIGPHESLQAAAELMARHRIRHLPVVEKGHLVGFVTDRDLRRAAPSPFVTDGASTEKVLEGLQVERVMIKAPATTTPDQNLKALAQLMADKKYGAVPVLEGGRLVGIVSMIDLLKVAVTLFP